MRNYILILSVSLFFTSCEYKDYYAEANLEPEITISLDGENYFSEVSDSIKVGFSEIRAFYKIIDDNDSNNLIIDSTSFNVDLSSFDKSIAITSDKVISESIGFTSTDPYGSRSTCYLNLVSFNNLAPVAVFEITETGGYAVNISAANSFDVDKKYGGMVTKYRYQISPSYDIEVGFSEINYDFGASGTYVIKVSVMDNQGLWSPEINRFINLD